MAAAAVATSNGVANNIHGINASTRFSDIPSAVDIPVNGEIDEAVEVNLEDQLDDPTELCQLLENERAAKNLWITISLAYAKQGQIDHALEILEKGSQSLSRSGPKERLSLLGCMAWLDLLKSRQAPRIAPEGQTDVKTKEYWLREATTHINDANRINPAFPPLLLTRGVLNLLKASLTASTKTGSAAETERTGLLREASRCFDDALRASNGRNMMAAMGKARSLYLLRQFGTALALYQNIMSRMPKLTEPDPRIGIGCCFWQLGYPAAAKQAWERAVDLQPDSKVAHALLGVYYLYEARKYTVGDPQFNILYGKAVKVHMQKAHALDKKFAFNCANFASYFLFTNRYTHLEALARSAIEQTDVNAIASDGWYLIAKKEHNLGDFQKASDAYNKADQARGGAEKGYWPAKFGMIQLTLQQGAMEDAKFRLEKAAQASKALEARMLLASIYAEDVFNAQKSQSKEDKTNEARKAITILESIRKSWADPKSDTKEDATVLIYLARLYEKENPTESAKCLSEIEKIEFKNGDISDLPLDADGNLNRTHPEFVPKLADILPPQLLNNIACFYYGSENYEGAAEYYQSALNAVTALNEKQAEEKRAVAEGKTAAEDIDSSDGNALITSITYNLGRAREALGDFEEAKKLYEKLLSRFPDYSEASARLAVIALKESPQDQGPRKIAQVYSTDYGHTEIRALMGWYYHSSKKKTANIAEDTEYRHYKHTLQGYDKYDLYSLTGMGNIHLVVARDMPRTTDAEKEKRSKMYQKAYEFFDKALQLDPKNAYAAQGVAIALCDDKKNYSDAVQILTKAKDTIRDSSVHVNLGHVYAELRQFQRSIDNYELALRKDGSKASSNAQLFACLSRVWLLKGKADKSIQGVNTALDYMKRALSTQPESSHIQFNVAFIQFQIVQLVNSTPEADRSLEDVDAAKEGLEEAIATFELVAKSKNPPYPRSALEQRAAMSKGTMRKQIERSHQQQAEYERVNADKIQAAKDRRAQGLREKAEAEQRELEALRRKKAEEVAKREEENKLVNARIEQERAEALAREAADYTDDTETGERVKRKAKPKSKGGRTGKKRDRDDDGFIEDDEVEGASERSVSRTPLSGASEDEGAGSGHKSREKSRVDNEPKKKRRKLERKGGASVSTSKAKDKPGKFKSAAVVVDSDSEEEAIATPAATDDDGDVEMGNKAGEDQDPDEDEEVQRKPQPRQRKQLRTIADDDDDEDDEEEEVQPNSSAGRLAEVARSATRVIEDEDEDE